MASAGKSILVTVIGSKLECIKGCKYSTGAQLRLDTINLQSPIGWHFSLVYFYVFFTFFMYKLYISI